LRETFVSFEQRDFRYLSLSTLAIGFGQWAQQIGLAWLVLAMTDSAAQLGTISAFRGGVAIITAPIGGQLADRYPRRMILVWSTAASMVQAVILAALIITGLIEVWHVYLLALFGGAIQSITQPARQAFVYDVSTDETLPNAIAMNSIVQNVARISGPPLAGAMIGFFGTGAPFVMLAATQVVAMWLTLLISKNNARQARVNRGSAWQEIVDGFKFTWHDRPILGLVLVATIPSLLVYPYLPFLSLVSRDVLGRGAQGYGMLASMAGWGSILGLLALAFLQRVPRKGLVMMVSFMLYTALVFAFAQSTTYFLSLLFLALAGIFTSLANALNNTLLQTHVRNELRGRVMSVWQLGAGLQPLGALPMGLLVARYGVQVGMGSFMVVALIAFALFTFGWTSVRRM
jgi:MFS family permease